MTTTRHDLTTDEARTIAEALRDYADSQDDPGQFIHVYDLATKIERTRDADHRAAGQMSDAIALDRIAEIIAAPHLFTHPDEKVRAAVRETGRLASAVDLHTTPVATSNTEQAH